MLSATLACYRLFEIPLLVIGQLIPLYLWRSGQLIDSRANGLDSRRLVMSGVVGLSYFERPVLLGSSLGHCPGRTEHLFSRGTPLYLRLPAPHCILWMPFEDPVPFSGGSVYFASVWRWSICCPSGTSKFPVNVMSKSLISVILFNQSDGLRMEQLPFRMWYFSRCISLYRNCINLCER